MKNAPTTASTTTMFSVPRSVDTAVLTGAGCHLRRRNSAKRAEKVATFSMTIPSIEANDWSADAIVIKMEAKRWKMAEKACEIAWVKEAIVKGLHFYHYC